MQFLHPSLVRNISCVWTPVEPAHCRVAELRVGGAFLFISALIFATHSRKLRVLWESSSMGRRAAFILSMAYTIVAHLRVAGISKARLSEIHTKGVIPGHDGNKWFIWTIETEG